MSSARAALEASVNPTAQSADDVYPAAELPRIAVERGAVTVEINLEDTPLSALYQYRLRGKSEVLADLSR